MESYIEFTWADENSSAPDMNIVNLDWAQMMLVARAMTSGHRFEVGRIDGPVSVRIEFDSPGDIRITKRLMTASLDQLFIGQQYIEFEAQRMLQLALMTAETHADQQMQRAAAAKIVLPD